MKEIKPKSEPEFTEEDEKAMEVAETKARILDGIDRSAGIPQMPGYIEDYFRDNYDMPTQSSITLIT